VTGVKEYQMNEKKNPIAERSKQWLVEALLELMAEKQYRDITIKEITERADLSRRTFYRNFIEKEDLLSEYARKLMEDYILRLRRVNDFSMHNVVKVYFTFWEEHLDFLKLLEKNQLLFLVFEKYNEFLPRIHEAIHSTKYDSAEHLEYVTAFNAGGYCNLLFQWLRSGAKENPEEMANTFLKLNLI
jgi:AcrR family transcriptional regulator